MGNKLDLRRLFAQYLFKIQFSIEFKLYYSRHHFSYALLKISSSLKTDFNAYFDKL